MPQARSKDNRWEVVFDNFYLGQGPVSHLNSLAEDGNSGHYSEATNVDITDPTCLTQGPGLSNLTAGTQAGAITEVTNFIMDTAVTSDVTYAIGATKLQKLSSTAVTNTGSWPHTITGATDGESCIDFQGALYYFFNKASGADIGKYDLSATFDDDWGSTVPTGAAALQSAPHPVAKKEDIMLFGNGRYVGTYVSATTTLAPTKLDLGANSEVADVLFHANQWYIAVNSGITSGTNRTSAQVYLYDGGAINSILSDEIAVGLQRIGFIKADNGLIFICYKDASGLNVYGFISGRSVVPLCYFTGNLPTYEKKTMYKAGFLAVESSGLIYVIGAAAPKYPVSISQLADGGYATCGAIAAPFGTLLVASTDGGSNHRLAKFSGYDTASSWKGLIHDLGGQIGYVDEVIVLTNHASSGASCALSLDLNQDQSNSSTMTLSASKRRHRFLQADIGAHELEDFRPVFDFSGGSTSNPMKIRKVVVRGGFKEG